MLAAEHFNAIWVIHQLDAQRQPVQTVLRMIRGDRTAISVPEARRQQKRVHEPEALCLADGFLRERAAEQPLHPGFRMPAIGGFEIEPHLRDRVRVDAIRSFRSRMRRVMIATRMGEGRRCAP